MLNGKRSCLNLGDGKLKGKYAMHNGSEYSFSLLEDKSIRLISHKQADLSQGFKHLDENIYIKNVSVEEVDLFKINSKAI